MSARTVTAPGWEGTPLVELPDCPEPHLPEPEFTAWVWKVKREQRAAALARPRAMVRAEEARHE